MERGASDTFRFFLHIEGFMAKKSVTAKDKEHLKALIREAIKKEGYFCDLNFINVSQITDMSGLFDFNSDNELGKFNGNISKWDVSNVKNMKEMFACSKFNRDISEWDVSNVTDMSEMFVCSEFNEDISKWNVSNVRNMSGMFCNSQFHGNISKWDVSNVTDMRKMFERSEFDGDISGWNVSNVTDMYRMFKTSEFNGDISKWNLAKLKNRRGLFYVTKVSFFPDKSIQKTIPKKVVAKSKKHLIKLIEKTIDEEGWEADLNFIDVSKITDMSELFSDHSNYDLAGFYGDISKWGT